MLLNIYKVFIFKPLAIYIIFKKVFIQTKAVTLVVVVVMMLLMLSSFAQPSPRLASLIAGTRRAQRTSNRIRRCFLFPHFAYHPPSAFLSIFLGYLTF